MAGGLLLTALSFAPSGRSGSDELRRRSDLVLRTASDTERSVIDAESALHGYALTGERTFLAPYRTSAAAARARAARLVAHAAGDPSQAARARRIARAVDHYLASYARPLLALAARSPRRARAVAATAAGKRRVDVLRADISALGAAEVDRLTQRTRGADRTTRRAIVAGIGGLLLLLAVLTAVGWYVARRVARPLQDMSAAAGRIAAGDLSVRVPEGGAGELDRLSHAFNTMAHSLGAAQAGLRARAVEVESADRRTVALLDTVFAQAPVGLAVLDGRMRFVRVNETLAAMDGVPADNHFGRGLDEILPGMAGEIGARLRDVLAERRTMDDAEVEGPTRADPAEDRVWRASYFPILTEEGATLGSGAIFVDITGHRRAARERRRLLDRERRAAQRTARLQELTARLSRAVGPRDVAQVVVEQGMAALGARAGVVVLAAPRSARLEPAAVAGYDDTEAPDWRAPAAGGRTPLADAVRTGATVTLPDRATLGRRYPGGREALERSGDRAWVAAPISVAGEVRGGALFAFRARPPAEDETRLLELLLGQAGQALHRAALYERQRHIASTLQRSLLPARMPEIPGVELAAVYRPAGDGNDVGGDFYDVVPTESGGWLIAIGDVQGKGPEAAALTGLVRHTLRAETMHRSDPGELLRLLNRVVYLDETERFCTVALAAIDPVPDRVEQLTVRIACGGHVPPIVTRRAGAPTELRCRGTLLGVDEDVRIPTERVALGVGDGLVLYTDGVLDAAAPAVTLTAPRLVALLAEAGARSPQDVADVLHRAAVGGTHAPRDDIAIIALRVADRPIRAERSAGVPPARGLATPL